MSLKWRLAVAAALAILVAALMLDAAVLVYTGRELASTRDRALRERAISIEQLVATAPALVTRPGALEAPLTATQTSVQLVDRSGAIIARSSSLAARPIPDLALIREVRADGRSRTGTVELGGDRLRLFVAPLPSSTTASLAGGAVIVAAPTATGQDLLDRLRTAVSVAALLAAGLAALLAILLTRRALRPLTLLADSAGEIARTRDPDRRLPELAVDDEVGRLSHTLNEMLAGLARAGEAERQFVGDVSHELRTPLTALRGNALHAARHGADAGLLADLAADADRLSRLVDDLLALARPGSAPDAAELVHLDELAEAAAEADARVHVEAPEPVAVVGDREALLRAVVNLVENARRYGPPGGPITIAVRRDGAVAFLSVADAGPGPASDDADRVFERFWRGGGSGRPAGSGLGLALVRATVERHGGSVAVTGSTFTLSLPALTDSSEAGGTPWFGNPTEGSS